MALLGLALPAAPASASGDDYPYRTQTNVNATDRWGFTERQCVSFVAWRMEQTRHTIHNGTGHWGSGYHWDDAAQALGKKVTATPKVGAVAQWNANESSRYYASNGAIGTIKAGAYGHVAYVSRVYSDGSVQIEQYNMSGNRAYSTMHVKAPRYIYVF
jgi:surface antigen